MRWILLLCAIIAISLEKGQLATSTSSTQTATASTPTTPTTGSTPTEATGSTSTGSTPTEATGSTSTGSTPTEATGSTPTEATGSTPTEATGSTPTEATGSTPTEATGSTPTAATPDDSPTTSGPGDVSDAPTTTPQPSGPAPTTTQPAAPLMSTSVFVSFMGPLAGMRVMDPETEARVGMAIRDAVNDYCGMPANTAQCCPDANAMPIVPEDGVDLDSDGDGTAPTAIFEVEVSLPCSTPLRPEVLEMILSSPAGTAAINGALGGTEVSVSGVDTAAQPLRTAAQRTTTTAFAVVGVVAAIALLIGFAACLIPICRSVLRLQSAAQFARGFPGRPGLGRPPPQLRMAPRFNPRPRRPFDFRPQRRRF